MQQRHQLSVLKKQWLFYSGKKKKHTIKALIAVNPDNHQVICTAFCEGKKHDLALFEDAGFHMQEETLALVDSGFQGMQHAHPETWLPVKKSKKKPLTEEEKRRNKELSSRRVLVENVIGSIKRFKIVSCRYRNRRKRFSLRFNLIAGIYNYELTN